MRRVDWVFIIWAPAWRWLGEQVTLDKIFLQYSSQTGSSSSPSYCHIFFLIAFFHEVIIIIIIKVIIILRINYTEWSKSLCAPDVCTVIVRCTETFWSPCIIIIYINKNAIINNNYRRLKDLILLFKILMGTRKDLLEIYKQFGLEPSDWFATPPLCGQHYPHICVYFSTISTKIFKITLHPPPRHFEVLLFLN